MKAKEKAKELFQKMYNVNEDGIYNMTKFQAKQCALVCVNEIIDQWKYIDIYLADLGGKLSLNLDYWLEVKEEILNL